MCPQAQEQREPPEAGTVGKDRPQGPPVGAQPLDALILDLWLPGRRERTSVVQGAQGKVICSEKWTRPPRWQDGFCLTVPPRPGDGSRGPAPATCPELWFPHGEDVSRPWVRGAESGRGARRMAGVRRTPRRGSEGCFGPTSPLPHSRGGTCGGGSGWLWLCLRAKPELYGPQNHSLWGPGLSRPCEGAAWCRGPGSAPRIHTWRF